MTDKYPYIWLRENQDHPRRRGQRCRVVARGGAGAVLVEFEDGTRNLTSHHAIRRPGEDAGADAELHRWEDDGGMPAERSDP